MNKQEIFQEEIKLIIDESLQASSRHFLETVPDYFFEVAASSTGKYHPEYALGKGGLVRHTKAAVKIAAELLGVSSVFNQYRYFGDSDRNLIIISLIFHDAWKHGEIHSPYTKFEHPEIAAKKVEESTFFVQEDKEYIASCIRSHMGQWNTSPRSRLVLPIPSNEAQNFVHLCDYLASRKYLELKF